MKKIAIHVSFFYIESRIQYVNRIIEATNQYDCDADIYIHTNAHDLRSSAFCPHTNGRLLIISHDLSLENPFYLTWKCRPLLKTQVDDYDAFMYIEDDILVPWNAIKYWLNNNERLIEQNYNLGFMRIEIAADGEEYITDLHGECFDTIIQLADGQPCCLNNKNPYCAFWIYNKAEFKRFVLSPYYDIQNIPEYPIREKSAIGLHGNLNYWYKGTVIPIIGQGLNPDCRIYHMPNNYVVDSSPFATIRFEDAIDKNTLKHDSTNKTNMSVEEPTNPLTIKISNEILDNFELKGHEYLFDKEYYDSRSGVNEYRLYSYLTTFFNNATILDIGTFTGRSAIALSYNETNRVISYDIEDHIKTHGHPIYTKSNVEFRIGDVLRDLTEDFIRTVKIVMIDIDHYGDNEKRILDRLKTLGFKGLILLDDITKHPDATINRCMNQFWDSIEDTCYDMTDYGHCTGTGIVVIGNNIRFCK